MPNKQTILIIEDDTMLLEMYKDKLQFEGYRVTTATDGKKALTRLKNRPDLVILDILMPHSNGFDVLKRIKSDPTTQDIPVIVLTNLGTPKTQRDKDFAMALGARDYLIKSLHTPDQVISKIDSILREVN